MSKIDKLVHRILSGGSDKNISFDEIVRILENFGFEKRVKGSHHIFFKNNVEEILNIQPMNDGKAKPYQVKQVREIILKYRLMFKTDNDE